MADAESTALAFSRACRVVDVDFVFLGSVAVGAWGQPRPANALEAIVGLDPGQVTAWVEALATTGLAVDARALNRAMEESERLRVEDEASGFHVLVKPATTPEERARLRESVSIPYEGAELRVPPPEDVVALNLRRGNTADLHDARSVLARQEGRLDMSRLHALAKQWDVEEALTRALTELRAE